MNSEQRWSGPWGDSYSGFFVLEPEQLDEHWVKTWSVRRSYVISNLLRFVPVGASILEVGCGTGNQLRMLKDMGRTDLTGIDINVFAVNKARDRGFEAACGTMLDLPFPPKSFDVVMTCGVISHMEPERVGRAISEICRVAKRWVFSTEYVTNTGGGDFMWAADYKRLFMDADPELKLIIDPVKCRSLGAGDLEGFVLERIGR